MPRTVGSYGLTRIEFEQDFRKYCDEHDLKPGAKAAEILDELDPKDRGDQRTFGGLMMILARFLTESDIGDNAQVPLQIAWRGDGTNG